MSDSNVTTNQISCLQTDRKLIAFYDKLKKAPVERYAQIHAKNNIVNGTKQNSLIGIQMQDYSNGPGKNNIIVSFNLEPEILKFIQTRIAAGFLEFEWSSSKIYGTPDPAGYSIAQNFTINRHNQTAKGTLSTCPWYIQISNGKGIKLPNKNGGFYMKPKSYINEKSAYINLKDEELYSLLERVRAYVDNWEASFSADLIRQGQETYAAYVSTLSNHGQNTMPPQPQPQDYSMPTYTDPGFFNVPAYGNAPVASPYPPQYIPQATSYSDNH